MTKLLIISDDLTGALDTGVMFVKAGAGVRVSISAELPELMSEVMVVDTETRHELPDIAYRIVYELVRKAKDAGVICIYKKTDSALRGNIGAELSAALRASKEKVLHFIPAFPEMNRYTEGGIHYIDGIPVSESVFGKDPFNPVRNDSVRDIIGEQSNISVEVVSKPERGASEKKTSLGQVGNSPFLPGSVIRIYDAVSAEELKDTAEYLKQAGELKMLAGCAGFAEELPKLLELGDHYSKLYGGSVTDNGFLVVCGSVNPITVSQLDHAEENGFRRIRLKTAEKTDGSFWKTEEGRERIKELKEEIDASRNLIIDSNEVGNGSGLYDYIREKGMTKEEMRIGITESLGELLAGLLDQGVRRTLMVIGGDTLSGFLRKAGVGEIKPLCEVKPGTVLTEIARKGNKYHLITKSGGFGDRELLYELSKL